MKTEFDVIIIGTGPAGISASLYTARASKPTLLIGTNSSSLLRAEKIENYYGLNLSLSGEELFETGLRQARGVGAEILEDQVVGISWDGTYTVKTTQGQFKSKVVIIATGIKRNTPKIEGIKELEGKGVSYCAVCDGFFYREKQVAVIGTGEYAIEEASHLDAIASKVTIVTNGEATQTRSECFEYIEKKIAKIEGTQSVEKIIFDDGTSIDVSGVFVAIGTAGATDLAKKLGAEVEENYIKTDSLMRTNLPGLYAAGDTTGGILQVAKAVYQGAEAGMHTLRYLRGLANDDQK